MSGKYTAEKNVQMLINILKANDIRKIVVSPGTTNCNFVYSLEADGNFEMFSSVDERSAAYIACGMAFESGEPVVITCTGATASRDYLPGLTEAYHRKLPVLAVTATQDVSNCGNLTPQFIDRSVAPADAVKMSVQIQNIKDSNDEWDCNVKLNRAVLELTHHGCGPVHINLSTAYNNSSVTRLPDTRTIRRITSTDNMPELPEGKIVISIGNHKLWSKEETVAVEKFCESNDAVVFKDHSSEYYGKYAINPSIIAAQENYKSDIFNIRLLIHIGEEHGDYYTNAALSCAKEVWRVSEDGEIRDTFRKLSRVFEMPEKDFFSAYCNRQKKLFYYSDCIEEKQNVFSKLSKVPFSNIYLAKRIAGSLPANSAIQLGVSNTMRSWTFFDFPQNVVSIANVGCRGIDGTLSALLGMSLSHPERLHFCVLGDLTFFYDMNALGNRHLGRNIRIILVNNGRGTEFRLYQHRANILLGDGADSFVAAAGHYGNQSRKLVKHYAEDLGFKYFTASNENELEKVLPEFLDEKIGNQPLLMEVFTDSADESNALKIIRSLCNTQDDMRKDKMRGTVKSILGEKGTDFVKSVIKR